MTLKSLAKENATLVKKLLTNGCKLPKKSVTKKKAYA